MTSTPVDLVKIFINSTGTGPISLGSAVPGFRGVEALTSGATYDYTVQQGFDYEYGTGLWVGSQLVRSPVHSSNGGSPIVLAFGTWVSFTLLSATLAQGANLALALLTSGQVAFTLPDIANGDTKPATGSGLPYLSAGNFKIA